MAVNTAGWPDATNTGVPAGVTLTPAGDIVVTKAGTVLSGLDIHGTVTVNAPNVTIENCRITYPTGSGSYYGILTNGDTVIQDCTINGNNSNSNGINGGGTFLRNNIYGMENGIDPGSNSLIQDNYIHDLKAPGSPHYDGIELGGWGNQDNITIRHNTVDMGNLGQTGAINLTNDFGTISNVTIDSNLLKGGSYTIYTDNSHGGGPLSNITITNNTIKSGQYGDFYFKTTNPTHNGNVDFDSGAALDGASTSAHTPPTTTPTTPADPGTTAGDGTTTHTGSNGSGSGTTSHTGTTDSGNGTTSHTGSNGSGGGTTTHTGSNGSGSGTTSHTGSTDSGSGTTDQTHVSGHSHAGHTHAGGSHTGSAHTGSAQAGGSQTTSANTGSTHTGNGSGDPTHTSSHTHSSSHTHNGAAGAVQTSDGAQTSTHSGSGSSSGGHHGAVPTTVASATDSTVSKGFDTIKAPATGAWVASHLHDSVNGSHMASQHHSSTDGVIGSAGSSLGHSGSGSTGHDTFVFAPNFGKHGAGDVSQGSAHVADQIHNGALDNFANLLSHASHTAQNGMPAGDAFTLKNATLDHHGSDFHAA